jgi:hypothetical protein
LAKQSGLAWSVCSVDDASGNVCTIINDITGLDFSTPREEQDVTGIDKSARERLLLLADFTISLKGVFNTTANQSHTVFKTVPSTSVARTTTLTVSAQTIAPEVLYTDYKLTRGEDGSLVFEAPGALSNGTTPSWS